MLFPSRVCYDCAGSNGSPPSDSSNGPPGPSCGPDPSGAGPSPGAFSAAAMLRLAVGYCNLILLKYTCSPPSLGNDTVVRSEVGKYILLISADLAFLALAIHSA